MPVHDIDMDPVGAVLVELRHLLAQPGKIGREDGRRDDQGLRASCALEQLAHGDGGVGHAVGEAPFIVVPREHRHEGAVENLGLVDARRSRNADHG